EAELRGEARQVAGERTGAGDDQGDVVASEKRQRAQQPVDPHPRLETPNREQKRAIHLEAEAPPSGGFAVTRREPLGVDEAWHRADPVAVQGVVLEEERAAEIAEDEDAACRR